MPYLLNFPIYHVSNSFNLQGNSDQLTFEVQANVDLTLEYHIVGGGQFLTVYSALWGQVKESAEAFGTDSHNIQVQDLPLDLGYLWDVWLSEENQPERSPLTWEMRSVEDVPDMSGIRGALVLDEMVPPGLYIPLTKVKCLIRKGIVIAYIHPIDGEISVDPDVYPADQFVFWFSPAGPVPCSRMDLQGPASPFDVDSWSLGNNGRDVTFLPAVSAQN